jgi:hypothetical protein
MSSKLIGSAKATGNFYNLYSQFVSDAPVWRLDVDRDRMASLDIDYGTAMQVLGSLTGGSFVNQTYEQQQYRQVYVQADGAHRNLVESLNNLYVPNRAGNLIPLANVVKAQLDAELRPDGYNIGINVGPAAGQTVMHLHMHLIPRFHGDVPDPRGGIRHVIPGKGNYLLPASDGEKS